MLFRLDMLRLRSDTWTDEHLWDSDERLADCWYSAKIGCGITGALRQICSVKVCQRYVYCRALFLY